MALLDLAISLLLSQADAHYWLNTGVLTHRREYLVIFKLIGGSMNAPGSRRVVNVRHATVAVIAEGIPPSFAPSIYQIRLA
jgi:hypothetical protein